MATTAETVKDALVGYRKPEEMSSETRANWVQFSKTDEKGESYMDRDAFIDAIAPPDEDYVSRVSQYHTKMLTSSSTRFPVSSTVPFSSSPTATVLAASTRTSTLLSRTCS